jgi:hypothetical protein
MNRAQRTTQAVRDNSNIRREVVRPSRPVRSERL